MLFTRKTLLFAATLSISATANATQPAFEISGALQDGNYGYSKMSPESSRFIHIEGGIPTVYQPKSSGCASLDNYGKVSFKQKDDQSIYVVIGNSSMPTAPVMRNVPGRSQRFSAPAEQVTTANHVPCTGKVVHTSE